MEVFFIPRFSAVIQYTVRAIIGPSEIAGTGRRLEPEDFLHLLGTDEFMGVNGCPDW